ncbi:MAG: AbgT family transporter [Maricaulis sp.]|nr:AbgT family transporter [Maricaulis sp.]
MVEKAGNRLPDPVTIFLILIGIVVTVSVFAAGSGLEATHPVTGDTIAAQSLLSGENIRRLLTEYTQIFVNFPPLGLVLVVMIGAGVAERTGLFAAGLRALVGWVPATLLTATLVFAGVMGNLAVDAGYVVLIPLGGLVFASVGRHPIAGIAATFAGVSAGFSANLAPGPLEPLLLGITQTAAQFIDPDWGLNILSNYFFIVALTPAVVIAGTFVTHRIIEPRLGPWTPPGTESDDAPEATTQLSSAENRGLLMAGLVLLAITVTVVYLVWPSNGILWDASSEGSELTPFFNSIVAISMLTFLLAGMAYGIGAGTIKSDKDVVKMASDAMGDMGIYIVLAFSMAMFLALFAWSNLGTILAIGGAATLQESGLPAPVLLIAMVLLTAVLNLFVGSASAKWAMLAPVAVPMLMLLGIGPDATTAAYRVGDGATNIITPLMPYMPLVLVFARRYMPEFGLGSLIATMLPYSIAILIVSMSVLGIFVVLDLPLGPGFAPVTIDPSTLTSGSN